MFRCYRNAITNKNDFRRRKTREICGTCGDLLCFVVQNVLRVLVRQTVQFKLIKLIG